MPTATYTFPHGFLWGTATASHQVEGYNTNSDWWAWEHRHAAAGHPQSGAACDWWQGNRYRGDFALAAAGGQTAHRLSVEWARLEPQPGVWDEAAFAFYRDLLQTLQAYGIKPLVTLCHYCHPQWFAAQGGWLQPESVAIFERYARQVVERLGDLVDWWCTLNEPNAYFYNAYVLGTFPPGKRDIWQGLRVNYHLISAHAAAYHAIHKIQPSAQVGWALYVRWFEPARSYSPLDRWVTGLLHQQFNNTWYSAIETGQLPQLLGCVAVPTARGAVDWVGLNYYTTDRVYFAMRPTELFSRREPLVRTPADISEAGFIANYPGSLPKAVKWLRGLGKPIYITENGVNDSTDQLRQRYLIEHLHALWHVTNLNYDVRGYFHWTLVDNFEWERGWQQRFGLYALDPQTQQRTARPSAELYTSICRDNGISSVVVEKFAPDLLARIFR
jgi:beta-glucosidase